VSRLISFDFGTSRSIDSARLIRSPTCISRSPGAAATNVPMLPGVCPGIVTRSPRSSKLAELDLVVGTFELAPGDRSLAD
jgi:hypothetical protein